jgi:hypothetical protein
MKNDLELTELSSTDKGFITLRSTNQTVLVENEPEILIETR